jgi:predicted TIM-barrel fold metal-dependent hydrolase
MLLENYRPRSKLVTKTTTVPLPRFPVIDAHNHLGSQFGGGWDSRPVVELLDVLDSVHVTHYVDLDGGWGEEILNRHLDHFKAAAPERFQVFGGVEWSRWTDLEDAFPEWAAGRLEVQKQRGAQGLKIWKPLGLHVRDHNGKLVDVDDPRLDPIWQAAGELNLPVLVHVADPVAFFDPIDGSNERWEEIGANPDWAFTSPPFPPFLHILDGFRNVVRKHQSTTFIGAHVGNYGENLAYVGEMLDECPNYYIDISARTGELGRQPYTARKFFIKHQDRILFGLDESPFPDGYRLSYRFLETDDEYFNYNLGDVPLQGRWFVCGLYLPDEVLEKVYNLNARRILGFT